MSVDLNLMGEIIPGLWIGSLHAVKEIRKLPDRQWTIISVLKSEKLSEFLRRQITIMEDSHPGLVHLHLEWDLPDNSQANFLFSERLDQILQEIDDAVADGIADSSIKRACLVHCAFGISRSAAVCAAWLMHSSQDRQLPLSLESAIAQIRAVRPDASPNIGFLASLRALEQCRGNLQAARERMRAHRAG